ncbi:MAG TPA: outer membrane protein transport protein [Burkholderiales bacterium]|nr:outer membrane protein transport protein [Burkholderiales bacterium]
MKRNAMAWSVLSALGVMAAASEAQAAAFALYEQGVSGLGNAYAGAAAVAEDATTVWWNPAGMARLGAGKHFAIAGALISPSTKFSNGSSTPAALSNPTSTGTGGDAGKDAIVPSMFYVMDLNPRMHFGIGISVPFGLKTEYESNWIGRFQGVSSEVKTVNINPSLSFKLSDTFSIGGGISYQRGKIDLKTGVNYSATAFSAGGAGLLGAIGGPGVEGQNTTSVDGDAWGFNIGTLFNVTPATRVGIAYRSSLSYKLDGNTSFSNVPAVFAGIPALAAGTSSGNVKLDLKTPDSLSFSLAHTLNERLDLLGDLTWWHWSKIKQLPLVRSSGAASGATLSTLTFNFDDTWRASIGANYKLNGPWTLKLGAAYDQTPVPNPESRTVRLPDADRYWLSAGAAYQISRNGKLDFGYTLVTAKNADINNNQMATGAGIINGSYKAHVHVLGVQYQHTF